MSAPLGFALEFLTYILDSLALGTGRAAVNVRRAAAAAAVMPARHATHARREKRLICLSHSDNGAHFQMAA